MRRLILCLVVLCAVALATATGAPARNNHGVMGKGRGGVMCALNATLRAKFETPPTTSTAKGHTLVKVWNDGTITFKTRINNRNHETFILAHIHQAPFGQPGPIVVPLFSGSTSARHIKQSGVATPNPNPLTATGAELCMNPSAYYVNYHTTQFPMGAIRGQLH
jgi:CHRD domain